MKLVKLIIWFIFTVAAFTLGAEMMTEPDTLVVLIGIIVIVVAILLSIKTRCFLDLKPLKFWNYKH